MKLLLVLLLPSCVIGFTNLISKNLHSTSLHNRHVPLIQKYGSIYDKNARMFSTAREKFTGFRKIIRSRNILPTLFLSFTGGYIQKTLRTPQFAISTAITALIMSTSMILNDLFDVELDRTNNPRRPLITGEVTKREAITYAASMIIAILALKTRLPPSHLRTITEGAIITITLYTPVLKRIPFVKNLACASLVAFSLFFAGNSLRPTPVLQLATQHLFVGSLYNEILLDMCDKVGDKANGVYTLPVLFGEIFTLHFISAILTINALLLCYRMGLQSIPVLFCMTPLYHNLSAIRDANYSPSIILDSAKQSSKYPLLLSFLYFCFLSRM